MSYRAFLMETLVRRLLFGHEVIKGVLEEQELMEEVRE